MLTLIMGASYSGTSLVAKLCHNNGAWMGDCLVEMPDQYKATQDYQLYENRRFRQLCRNALRIDSDLRGKNIEGMFQLFFKSIPDDQPAVVKYPKSFYLIEAFDHLGIDFQVIYVIRNPWQRSIRWLTREPSDNFCQGLAEWNDAYLAMSKMTRRRLHAVIFERLVSDPQSETQRLMEFVGLEGEPDISAVDKGKQHA